MAHVTNYNYSPQEYFQRQRRRGALRSNSNKCVSASAHLFSAPGKEQKTWLRLAPPPAPCAGMVLQLKTTSQIDWWFLVVRWCSHQESVTPADNLFAFSSKSSRSRDPAPPPPVLRFATSGPRRWGSIPVGSQTATAPTLIVWGPAGCAPTRNRTWIADTANLHSIH